ncbi:MAG: FmdB family transcriptional regulator [Proteobacteria bacterium]|nr:FmdB family transcriptional regulator [Pseudomonadota bacterium]
MPFYEYKCPDCGHRFEELQSFNDPPITACPMCSKGNVKKLLSRSSFVLKGGGWYKDHYGLKQTGSSASDSKAGDSGSGSGGSQSKSSNDGSSAD